ncbi:MAG: flagellar hook-associated protein FlgK [Caldimonas sp.]
MSVSPLLTIGSKAMSASYAALQVTGNNISNSNTVGYSRQSAMLETSLGQFSGSGYFGKGVDVTTVTRAHSDFLTREAATSQSMAAGDAARSEQLQRLETVFPTGEAGIGYAAATAFNAFVDVANKPQDASARSVALARVGDLAALFRTADEQLNALQAGVTIDLKTSVTSINGLTRQIAGLNQQIASMQGNGHEPNDLLDKRDLAINELSKYLQVSTIAADDGSLSVFMNGGQRLVLGGEASTLAAVPDAYDPAKVQLGITEAGQTRALPSGFVTGGSVAGLLRFQNSDLPDARNLLGQMAAAISGRLNQQQALGLDLGQPPGSGAPLLSVGSPGVSPASTNAQAGGVAVASYINGSGVRVPSVSLTIVDSDALRASDYELRSDPADPAGTYRLTRLSDGTSQSVVSGAVVDGFRVDVATPLPVARDRFLLQPVAPAISHIRRVLDDPAGLAAASPVTATVANANTGTAAVASLSAISPSLNPNLTATITFTDDAGGYSYSLVDTTGALPTTSGTGTWTAGQPVKLNGWSMELSGVPRSGDVIGVQRTAFPAGNNGNANALLALRDVPFVGQQTLAGGVIQPGDTVTDAYAAALAKVGVRVQSAKFSADQSASIAADAKLAQSSATGVNLDEEAARLIQFQQSYQAAARMLQVAQSLFDTLLQAAG